MDQEKVATSIELTRGVRAGALLFVVLVVLAACGGRSTRDDDILRGADVEVLMFDNRFEYTEIRIPVGGSVNWITRGTNPHNSVDANGAWSTEEVFGSLEQLEGDSALITYKQAGVYTFFAHFTAIRTVLAWRGHWLLR